MKALIKVLNWIEWISAVIGVVFILLGAFAGVFKIHIIANQAINYFNIANSFFLLAIVLFLFIHLGQFKKEQVILVEVIG
jgi:predicted ATPase